MLLLANLLLLANQLFHEIVQFEYWEVLLFLNRQNETTLILYFFQFIWQPYSEDVLASLPAYCTAGRDIWRSVTYLICWDVVEPHLPHRVMRQFGFHQSLPDMRLTDNQAALHSLDRRGRANQDWSTTHRQYIDIWTDRRVHVQDGTVIEDTTYPSDEYVQWYRERTVIYISNPSRFPAFPEGFQGDSARAQYLVSLFPTHF